MPASLQLLMYRTLTNYVTETYLWKPRLLFPWHLEKSVVHFFNRKAKLKFVTIKAVFWIFRATLSIRWNLEARYRKIKNWYFDCCYLLRIIETTTVHLFSFISLLDILKNGDDQEYVSEIENIIFSIVTSISMSVTVVLHWLKLYLIKFSCLLFNCSKRSRLGTSTSVIITIVF